MFVLLPRTRTSGGAPLFIQSWALVEKTDFSVSCGFSIWLEKSHVVTSDMVFLQSDRKSRTKRLRSTFWGFATVILWTPCMICYPIGVATYELSDTVCIVNVKKRSDTRRFSLLYYHIGVIHIDMDSMSGNKFNPWGKQWYQSYDRAPPKLPAQGRSSFDPLSCIESSKALTSSMKTSIVFFPVVERRNRTHRCTINNWAKYYYAY